MGSGRTPAELRSNVPCENARWTGSIADVNSEIVKSFPVRFVGSFIAAVVVAIVLYLGAVLSVYLLGWILGLIESI